MAGADLTATPFVAPEFDRPSGLTLSYAIEPGGRVSATGIALAAYGSFLLKVRMAPTG